MARTAIEQEEANRSRASQISRSGWRLKRRQQHGGLQAALQKGDRRSRARSLHQQHT